MFSLSFPANVGCIGCGSGEAKEPGGEMSCAPDSDPLSDVEFGKISPAGQSKLAVRIPQLDIVFTFLSLRLAERMHELSTSIGGLSLER